jgi:hypothetical protein
MLRWLIKERIKLFDLEEINLEETNDVNEKRVIDVIRAIGVKKMEIPKRSRVKEFKRKKFGLRVIDFI